MEQPVWPPIALIGVTLSACLAPMAVITMILVKITVPFYDGDPNNDDEDLGL